MGFSLDPTKKPVYADTPTQTVADLQAAVNYAELVGGVLKGTAADRDLLAAGELTVGWLFSETDTGKVYRWGGSGWALVHEDTGWVLLPLSNSWNNFGGAYATARARRMNGVVHVTGLVKEGSVNPGVTIATLPVGMRPAAYQIKTVWVAGSVARSIEIAPDGRIVVGDTAVNAVRTTLDCTFPAEQ